MTISDARRDLIVASIDTGLAEAPDAWGVSLTAPTRPTSYCFIGVDKGYAAVRWQDSNRSPVNIRDRCFDDPAAATAWAKKQWIRAEAAERWRALSGLVPLEPTHPDTRRQTVTHPSELLRRAFATRLDQVTFYLRENPRPGDTSVIVAIDPSHTNNQTGVTLWYLAHCSDTISLYKHGHNVLVLTATDEQMADLRQVCPLVIDLGPAGDDPALMYAELVRDLVMQSHEHSWRVASTQATQTARAALARR